MSVTSSAMENTLSTFERYFYPLYICLLILVIFAAFPNPDDFSKLDLFLRLFVQGIIPLVTAFVAVKYVFVRQKKHEDDIEILLAANQLILDANQALTCLEGIKANYRNTLSNDPKVRFLQVKIVKINDDKIDVKLNRLTSILQAPITEKNKWASLVNVQNLFRNYNYLLHRWALRNEAKTKMLENLIFDKLPIVCVVRDSEFQKKDVKQQIRDTEYMINFIDQTMQCFKEFLAQFPEAVENCVENKTAKEKVKIFCYENTRAPYTDTNPCVEVDFLELSKILDISVHNAKNIFEDRSLVKRD